MFGVILTLTSSTAGLWEHWELVVHRHKKTGHLGPV